MLYRTFQETFRERIIMNNRSKRISAALLFALLAGILAAVQAQTPTSIPNGLPSWAYNIPDKDQPPATPLKGTIRVAGSSKEYDAAQVRSTTDPPDWFPDEHPQAPAIVKGPNAPPGALCGTCHLMSGQGHPESADIAGLPAEYIVRQMKYFKSGARKDNERMTPIAKNVSDEDVRQAADYFAAIKPMPWVKVVETATPPKTYVSIDARHRVLDPSGGTEQIGHRIIETPVDPMQTSIRNPHSAFIAYVPPGSIAKGEALVKTGGAGKTIQCATCHGDDLKGLGDVPRLAGLQPVYMARQLICMQNGSSAGTAAALMKKVVANLSEDDIISISAYLGSLPPR
jgi:cytochrome c553